jgi:ribosomal protein S18 acetylase RimI-like enzyme
MRTPERESQLLDAGLDAILASPTIRRVESQLMMLGSPDEARLPYANYLSTFGRLFMRIDLCARSLPEARPRRAIYLEKWSEKYQDAAAQLIAAAYGEHIDSRINDQYRTPAGARKFLYNIVQYPGCGAFYRPASYAAFDAGTGNLCGVSLASLVALECGHITQICVSPAIRGTGVGYALLRQSLITMKEMGCRSASLTVTASNREAVDLYERAGFGTVRRFSAFVWEGF